MMDELGLEDIDMNESEVTSHMASLGHSPERSNIPASARSGVSDWDTSVADETPRDSKALGDVSKKANPANESKAKPANKATHDSDSQWDSDDDNEIPVLPSEAGKGKQLDRSGALASGACGSAWKKDAVQSTSGSVSTDYDMEEEAEKKPSAGSLFDSENSSNCDRKEKPHHDENMVNCDQLVKLLDAQNAMNCDEIVKLLDAQNSMNCDQVVKLFEGEDSTNCGQNVRLRDGVNSMNCDQVVKLFGAQNSVNCDRVLKLFDGEDSSNCGQNVKLFDAQNSMNCGQTEKLLDAQHPINCDQKEKLRDGENSMNCDKKEVEDCLRVEESCGKKMSLTADEQYDDDDDDNDDDDNDDDDWDADDDSEKKDAKEEEKKEGEMKVEKCNEEEIEEEKDKAEERRERKKEQEKQVVEQMDDGQEKLNIEEKKKEGANEKEEEKKEGAEKKKKTDEKLEWNEEEKEALGANVETVKPNGEKDIRNLESSLSPALPLASGTTMKKEADHKDSLSSPAGNTTAANVISKEFICDAESSETSIPEVSSSGTYLSEDSIVSESECVIDSKETQENKTELFNKNRENNLPDNEAFDAVECPKENADVKSNSKVDGIENLAEICHDFDKKFCAEILLSPILGLEGSSSKGGHNQNLSSVIFETSDCNNTAMKTSEREFDSGLEATSPMTQQTVAVNKVPSKIDIMDRMISPIPPLDAVSQKTKTQEEDKKNEIAETRLSLMYGLSSLEEVCEISDECSLDELLENCPKFDCEKNEEVTLDDLVTYQDVHALKENVTKEANVTEDEEESTWEKERKLAKKSTEKQKTAVKDGVTTENAQSSQVIVPDYTSSQPEVNTEHRAKEVVLSSPPLEANRDRDLNLSNASASSFQQKQASATSSGRIPLASAVTPLAIKMSQEESSDTDEPFSPIGSARSTARSVSLNTDMNNVIRLQEMIRDGQRKLESERSAKTLLETKRKALENERAKLVEQLHVVTREKFNLDQLKIDLESKVRHLEYQMSEETEKRKNTDVLYEKTKEQLTRKDEQCLQLTEAKQKTETSLKNEQKEKASAMAVVKQLEDENEALKRQLNEKNIFVVQDEGTTEHRQRKSVTKSSAMVGSEGYPQLIPTVGAASTELYATQLAMNRDRERTKDTVEELMHENEELRKLNKELTEKWTRGEDALTHASLYYNLDVVQLKADNDRLSAQLERDSAGKEELEREVNSLKLQLTSLTSELQAARDAKTEIERQRRNHADDFNRISENHNQELSSTKSLCQSQSQQLSEVLPKLQKLESELVVANTLLSERTNQLTNLQKDLDKRSSNQDTLDENYRKQKEENIRLEAKVESLQERLSETQEELRIGKQSTESRRLNGEQPDDLATLLSTLKAEHDRAKGSLEDRNASLMESLSKTKEELKTAERGRLSIEDEKRRLQTVLSETQKQQLASEASLQMANQARQQLEAERSQLKIEIDGLKDKLEDDRQRILRLDQRILELNQQLKMAESSATNSHEQLNKESNSLQGLLRVKHDLEDNLHKTEVENAKLEAALTHERQKVALIQKDYTESKQNQNQLEDEFEKLKSTNKELQYLINEAAGLKTLATQEADDNRALWESEIKSRSKLGLRLAQLDREKRDLDSKVQEEKRRVRRALELKKSTEEKLEEEQGRSSQLQKEVSVLKVHLKAAKKRIKDLQVQGQTVVRCQRCRRSGVDSDILDNGSEAENIYQNGHSPVQLDFAKHQLHYEPAAKDHRHRGSGVSDFDKLRNMENVRVNGSIYHLDQMPQQMVGSNYLATSEIDRIREKLKSEAQMELNLKLQEVNRYLDDQAVARERLDRIRDINEAEMRNEFEKVRKEMLEEISKVKHNFEGNVPSVQKGPRSNETQQQMKELNEREVKLQERLLDRLDNAYSKVTNSNVDRLHPSIMNVEDDALFDRELAKSNVQHGLNDDTVMNNLRHQLDRSIARHMAAVTDDHNEVTANPLLLDPVGSGRNSSNVDATSVLHRNFLL